MGRPPVEVHMTPDVLEQKIEVIDGHWVWTGNLSSEGYGRWCYKDEDGRWRQAQAHCVMWLCLVGPIPDGMIVHHDCQVRCCVNPVHLELTTRPDHPDNRAHQLAARTDCNYGHNNWGLKTWKGRGTFRYCKTCVRSQSRKRVRA